MIRMMLFILIPFASISQEPAEGVFPLKNGSIYYERIVTADSISKNTLYSAAKFWALDNFNSQKEPLQIDDKESGIVAYKGFFTETFNAPEYKGIKNANGEWKYWFIMKVQMKDGKAKIVVDDLSLEGFSILHYKEHFDPLVENKYFNSDYKKQYYEETRENFIKTNEHVLSMISSLEKALKSGKNGSDFNP